MWGKEAPLTHYSLLPPLLPPLIPEHAAPNALLDSTHALPVSGRRESFLGVDAGGGVVLVGAWRSREVGDRGEREAGRFRFGEELLPDTDAAVRICEGDCAAGKV